MFQSPHSSVFEKRVFQIGADCHGTTMDNQRAFMRYLRKFGINIPPEHVKRSHIVGRYLSEESYDRALDKVFANIQYAVRWVKAMPEAIPVLKILRSEGHSIKFVTSSSPMAEKAIQQWLLCNELKDIAIIALGRGALKGCIASEFDIFIDDRPEQVEDLLANGLRFPFLLTTPTNADTPVSEGIVRVASWKEFLDRVHALLDEHPQRACL
jgi:hypothetical protein